jgi:hypothetical protein
VTTTVILNGNSYNDGSTPPGNMGNGGHADNFMRCLSDMLVEIENQVTDTAQRFQGTTTTSVSVAASTVTVVTQTGLSFVAGQSVTIYSAASLTTAVSGAVVTYNIATGTLSISVARRSGSGSFTDGVITPGMIGPDGIQGIQGFDGDVGIRVLFDGGSQADSDPGNGKLRLNNATQSSATIAYIDNQSAGGAAIQAWLDTWDDSTNPTVRGSLTVRAKADPTKFLQFQVTGAVLDGGGYRKVPLAYVAGSASSPFADTDPLSILFVRAGDVGQTGAGSTVSAQRAGVTITAAPRANVNFGPEFSVVDDGDTANSFTTTLARTWTDIVSASTMDAGAVASENLRVTGAATIMSLGTTGTNGMVRTLRFIGALTLTHNVTSLILPSGQNITTAANDVAAFKYLGAGNWICTHYQRADGSSIAPGGYRLTIRNANVQLVTSDAGKHIDYSGGGFTQTFDTAGALGVRWSILASNSSSADVMMPATIDSQPAAWPMLPGEMRLIESDGTNITSKLLVCAAPMLLNASKTFNCPPGYGLAVGAVQGGQGGGGGSAGNYSYAYIQAEYTAEDGDYESRASAQPSPAGAASPFARCKFFMRTITAGTSIAAIVGAGGNAGAAGLGYRYSTGATLGDGNAPDLAPTAGGTGTSGGNSAVLGVTCEGTSGASGSTPSSGGFVSDPSAPSTSVSDYEIKSVTGVPSSFGLPPQSGGARGNASAGFVPSAALHPPRYHTYYFRSNDGNPGTAGSPGSILLVLR